MALKLIYQIVAKLLSWIVLHAWQVAGGSFPPPSQNRT